MVPYSVQVPDCPVTTLGTSSVETYVVHEPVFVTHISSRLSKNTGAAGPLEGVVVIVTVLKIVFVTGGGLIGVTNVVWVVVIRTRVLVEVLMAVSVFVSVSVEVTNSVTVVVGTDVTVLVIVAVA